MKKRYFLLIFLCGMAGNMIAQTCGTTNIALTKTASASSDRAFSGAPNVVDGSTSTNWKSADKTGTQWIMVDLGQAYSICNIKIKWAQDNYYASNFKVYVSNTEAAGTGTIVFQTTTSAVNENDITLASPVSGQYVRVEMTATVASWADHYEMIELEAYAGTGNVLPVTSITSPAANATFSYGSTVSIAASASDADGSVSKVEFYEGTNKLGEDATAPYTFNWTNAPAGTYTLTTKAIDDDNGEGTSAAVSITVSNPPATAAWSLTGNSAVDANVHFVGTKNAADLVIKTGDVERMRILANGKVLIKTGFVPNEEADFAVNGNIYAKKLRITQTNWPDYVFDSAYKLRPLKEVEAFIEKNKHLPDVPSAKEVEQHGVSVGDQQAVLLRKMEEMTLYIIQQQKEIEALKTQLKNKDKKTNRK